LLQAQITDSIQAKVDHGSGPAVDRRSQAESFGAGVQQVGEHRQEAQFAKQGESPYMQTEEPK
jgi:hypothetical protein